MDAFTPNAGSIGVPTVQSGALFQQAVSGMNVRSSVPGVLNADALSGGNIEFWPSDYGPTNTGNVPGASSTSFDFGDSPGSGAGYGSMQVHNSTERQTLFAFNGWGKGDKWRCDLGIGNYSGQSRDWTYATTQMGIRLRNCRSMCFQPSIL